MKHIELHRFKKAIGTITFGLFFPNENKKLNQKHGIGKQPDLVLVTPGNQKTTVRYIGYMTGWTVKKCIAFYKEGDYPKVVVYNVDPKIRTPKGKTIEEFIEEAADKKVIFKIY